MRVFRGLEHNFGRAVVAVGSFDGVHSGHVRLISQLNFISANESAEGVVLIFDPHPRFFFGSGSDFRLLSTLSERLYLLERAGVQNVVVVDFTSDFASMSSERFVRDFLIEGLGCIGVVVGFGHTFGSGGVGCSYSDYGLREYLFERYDSISSSMIRHFFVSGDLELGIELLGGSYYIETPIDLGLKLLPSGDIFLCEFCGQDVLFSRSEISGIIEFGSLYIKKRMV